jgi:hypothetical protein
MELETVGDATSAVVLRRATQEDTGHLKAGAGCRQAAAATAARGRGCLPRHGRDVGGAERETPGGRSS